MSKKKQNEANGFGDILAAFNAPAVGEKRVAQPFQATPRVKSSPAHEQNERARVSPAPGPVFGGASFPWPTGGRAGPLGSGRGPAQAYAEATGFYARASQSQPTEKRQPVDPPQETFVTKKEGRVKKVLRRLFHYVLAPWPSVLARPSGGVCASAENSPAPEAAAAGDVPREGINETEEWHRAEEHAKSAASSRGAAAGAPLSETPRQGRRSRWQSGEMPFASEPQDFPGKTRRRGLLKGLSGVIAGFGRLPRHYFREDAGAEKAKTGAEHRSMPGAKDARMTPPRFVRTEEDEAIAKELCLTPELGTIDLKRIRRDFAKKNHPDRFEPARRRTAERRMSIANMLIDEQIRQNHQSR